MSTPQLQLTARLVRGREKSTLAARLWGDAEWLLAATLLLLLLPLLAGVMLAVFLLSGRSPLIMHRRVGKNGSSFWMLKIRTMWERREPLRLGELARIERLVENYVPEFKPAEDPRVTSRFAAFCRRASIDEMPQLLHVLAGEMRLVGPRPITRQEWDQYYGPSAHEVLCVAPGITGLWQVTGRNRLTYRQRRRLDLFYARHASPGFDLTLLLRTPVRVLTGRDAG